MRKVTLVLGEGSKCELEILEKRLKEHAEQAQMEVGSVIQGNFSGMNTFKIGLMNLKQMKTRMLLVDSIEALGSNIDVGELHQILKENELSCYCIKNDLTLGASSQIEMKPHKRKAWLMTNGQDGVLSKLKQYAMEQQLEIVCVNEEKICCDYPTFEARMIQMLKDKTEIILVPDDTIFNTSDDPSLHTMTKLAIEYDIDIVITDMNLNICEMIKDTQNMFEMITNQQKQYAAMICTQSGTLDDEILLNMSEQVYEKNCILKCVIEVRDVSISDEIIDNVIKQNVNILFVNQGTILSTKQKERLENNDIEIEEVEMQTLKQSQHNIQHYQA